MTGIMPEFTGSDAWLLLSIAVADDGNGASLQSIIAVGDWINHAIFTGPELRRGLAKLLHVGYVTENEGRFSLSGTAKTYWVACRDTHKSAMDRMKDLEDFLEVSPQSSQNPMFEDPEWRFPGITDEMIHQAYQEYIGRSRTTKRPRKALSL